MCEARCALLSIAKPGAISPPAPSGQGRRLPLVSGNSMTCYAVLPIEGQPPFDEHLNSVPSTHMRCKITASAATLPSILVIAYIEYSTEIVRQARGRFLSGSHERPIFLREGAAHDESTLRDSHRNP
jgi:hypothetical protein